MKVRVGQILFYVPTLLDRIDQPYNVREGYKVRVINLHGAPKANTMGHCYVELLEDEAGNYFPAVQGQRGEVHQPFGGLVCCNSLHTRADYVAYLKAKIAAHKSEDNEVLA